MIDLTILGTQMRINKRIDYVLYSPNTSILQFCIKYYIFDERKSKRIRNR